MNAARAADWPRLADAWGSQRHDLELKGSLWRASMPKPVPHLRAASLWFACWLCHVVFDSASCQHSRMSGLRPSSPAGSCSEGRWPEGAIFVATCTDMDSDGYRCIVTANGKPSQAGLY